MTSTKERMTNALSTILSSTQMKQQSRKGGAMLRVHIDLLTQSWRLLTRHSAQELYLKVVDDVNDKSVNANTEMRCSYIHNL